MQDIVCELNARIVQNPSRFLLLALAKHAPTCDRALHQ
jgi:hypothetical protein